MYHFTYFRVARKNNMLLRFFTYKKKILRVIKISRTLKSKSHKKTEKCSINSRKRYKNHKKSQKVAEKKNKKNYPRVKKISHILFSCDFETTNTKTFITIYSLLTALQKLSVTFGNRITYIIAYFRGSIQNDDGEV